MRSIFCGIGLFTLMWGSLFLFTQQLEIHPHQNLSAIVNWGASWSDGAAVIHPPEWAAFSLLLSGFLMVLYAVGLPARKRTHKKVVLGLEDPYNGRLTQSLIRVRAASSPQCQQQC